MIQDIRDLPVTTGSIRAAVCFDAALDAVLEHRADAAALLRQTLAADPGHVLALCLQGAMAKLGARRELDEPARLAWLAARLAMRERGATARERAHVDALAAWVIGDMREAASRYGGILALHPTDLLAVKLAHAIRFMLGDSGLMRSCIERVLPHWSPRTPGYGYVLGCHAFALEETGALDLAERQGRRAVEINPADAWAVHAVGHVHLLRGELRQGVAWLESTRPDWTALGNFRRHLAWHEALFRLELGEIGRTLELYDLEIRDEPSTDIRDVANATSLLARLELHGVDVGRRWEELADIAEARVGDASLALATLHDMLALASARRDGAVTMLQRALRFVAGRLATTQSGVIDAAGLMLADALAARGAGAHGRALASFMAARHKLGLVGGSHAQRDVFRLLAIDSARRIGRHDEVRRLMAERQAIFVGGAIGWLPEKAVASGGDEIRLGA